MRTLQMVAALCLLGCASRAAGQDGQRANPLPLGYGSLTQDDVALRLRGDDLEIRFIPLHAELAPLMARDTYLALHGIIESHRHGIDSVAARGGVSHPGLALVSFFGLQSDVRFDPQILALLIRSQVFQPLGIVPLSPRFSSGQLGVRDQVSAIYVFDQDIPVNDSFTLSYGGLTADWGAKQSVLDRERARVAARSRTQRPDTTTGKK